MFAIRKSRCHSNEREYSLPVKIVISISYTPSNNTTCLFCIFFVFLFGFICFIRFYIFIDHRTNGVWRICTYKQTINIQRLNRSPFLRANFVVLLLGSTSLFFFCSHSSLPIITQESDVCVCSELSHTIAHVLHYYKVCVYKL